MKRKLIALTFISTILATSFSAQANPTTEKGGVLTTKEGRALYTFDKDSTGHSNCSGGCLAAWPPFAVSNAAMADADFTVIKREDGTQQWAYEGKPLYLFSGDANPGDMNGDNKNGVWHLIRSGAKPAAAKPSSSYSSYGSY
ncbi:hypothetical protein [Propionivibrio sp.]|uniref:COG4315 family predicted lipoprotein n=1 Tax=Propionivibrio sp. TaxID=2212460 RepID=UPI0025FD6254|nr:hypothetical protein [Propionivibrio sp.]MBK7355080.1 hypothetical protein [Propionivibrio sp.]MBK8402449.1 hypothetical protein [Propionivibrio sp.]MBK8743603.1 hypothetical protein [Propionivibrio sp.]MBK8892908.1 hypothetical protein [Propionivibrio sp.]MBL0206431.1 hypothetical protein [Propionivibrio sp.]